MGCTRERRLVTFPFTIGVQMAFPGWGAISYVAGSAYSYATGTYPSLDAKRLLAVQSAYKQAYNSHEVW